MMRVTSSPPVFSVTSKCMLRDTATFWVCFFVCFTQLKTEMHQFETKAADTQICSEVPKLRWTLSTYSPEKCFKAAGSFKLQI